MTGPTGKKARGQVSPGFLAAAREGDGDAFARLVEFYRAPLTSFVRLRYRNLDTPEDLIQETWANAHKRMQRNYTGGGKFDPAKSSFDSWIRTILDRKCLDELRKQKKQAGREIHLADLYNSDDASEDEGPRYGKEGLPSEARDGLLIPFIRAEHEKAIHARGALLAKQVREKGMKGARLSYMSFTPGWQKVVIDLLSRDHPGDSRRLFEARRILAQKETERGIKEWALAIERAQRGAERQLTYEKLWILVDICVEAALRSRLPRTDPDRVGEKDFAPWLSISLYCVKGLRGGHGPLYEASAAFTNATFLPKRKWTGKRVRQAACRRGLTPEALHKAQIK